MKDRFEQKEYLVEKMGDSDAVLEALTHAMSNWDFNELFEYIVRMYDLEDDE